MCDQIIGDKVEPFNVKKHFPEARAIFYTGLLDLDETRAHCSKELINRMIIIGETQRHELKKILLSEEDMKDICSYSNDVESVETAEMRKWMDTSGSPYWGISLQIDDRLGGSGVIIGQTADDWAIIVGETGRYL